SRLPVDSSTSQPHLTQPTTARVGHTRVWDRAFLSVLWPILSSVPQTAIGFRLAIASPHGRSSVASITNITSLAAAGKSSVQEYLRTTRYPSRSAKASAVSAETSEGKGKPGR